MDKSNNVSSYKTMTTTQLLAQYKEIKERHKDSILSFRMGDFYEMFYDDAITASKLLEITLTARNREKGEDVPMCGVPYHAANAYIAKLIKKGFKVAICEQLEDPKSAKGIVKRDVVRIITPGTAIDPLLLDSKENNFIAAIYPTPLSPPLVRGELKGGGQFHRIGLAILDISTGDFFVSEFAGEYNTKNLTDELSRFMPKEALKTTIFLLIIMMHGNSQLTAPTKHLQGISKPSHWKALAAKKKTFQ